MVKLLADAAYENKKTEMHGEVLSQVVAFSHVLDQAFNRGKGNILDKFTKKLFEGKEQFLEERKEKTKNYFTDEAFSFLTGRMPRKLN